MIAERLLVSPRTPAYFVPYVVSAHIHTPAWGIKVIIKSPLSGSNLWNHQDAAYDSFIHLHLAKSSFPNKLCRSSFRGPDPRSHNSRYIQHIDVTKNWIAHLTLSIHCKHMYIYSHIRNSSLRTRKYMKTRKTFTRDIIIIWWCNCYLIFSSYSYLAAERYESQADRCVLPLRMMPLASLASSGLLGAVYIVAVFI